MQAYTFITGADLLVSSITMPMVVYTILAGEWVFSRQLCVAMGFITMLTFIASVMSLAAISINRYVIVCHPYDVAERYTPMKTAIWIMGNSDSNCCLISDIILAC